MNYKRSLVLNAVLAAFSLYIFINKFGKGGSSLQLYCAGISFLLFILTITIIIRKRRSLN